MTQVTMLDIVAPGAGAPVTGTGRHGADLAAPVPAPAARQALQAGAAAALLALDDLASTLFEDALADPEVLSWPLDLARVHLLYGERLRRSRDITLSRHHLQAALTAFELLGASGWAQRAAAELAATAPTRQRRETGHCEPLTGQELQVAELAAVGLSNKQIGVRLHMSHRTVGAHLYRIFPKLGISSRAALRDALSRERAQLAVQRA
jgi:ATP/maltotriose-dependent transcriptional regulator MalT